MVGWNTIVSFWDGLFSGAMLVSGRVLHHQPPSHVFPFPPIVSASKFSGTSTGTWLGDFPHTNQIWTFKIHANGVIEQKQPAECNKQHSTNNGTEMMRNKGFGLVIYHSYLFFIMSPNDHPSHRPSVM